MELNEINFGKIFRNFQKRIPYISLRMFNVYGPGQDMNNLRQGMVKYLLSPSN